MHTARVSASRLQSLMGEYVQSQADPRLFQRDNVPIHRRPIQRRIHLVSPGEKGLLPVQNPVLSLYSSAWNLLPGGLDFFFGKFWVASSNFSHAADGKVRRRILSLLSVDANQMFVAANTRFRKCPYFDERFKPFFLFHGLPARRFALF